MTRTELIDALAADTSTERKDSKAFLEALTAIIERVIRDGGEAVGLTRFMPSFGFNMTAKELRSVVAHLRFLQSSAN